MRMSHNYNYLDLTDFDNTNITLVFEPDEDVDQPVNEKSARIFVTDDAINEAREQVFIAELMLVQFRLILSSNYTTINSVQDR